MAHSFVLESRLKSICNLPEQGRISKDTRRQPRLLGRERYAAIAAYPYYLIAIVVTISAGTDGLLLGMLLIITTTGTLFPVSAVAGT